MVSERSQSLQLLFFFFSSVTLIILILLFYSKRTAYPLFADPRYGGQSLDFLGVPDDEKGTNQRRNGLGKKVVYSSDDGDEKLVVWLFGWLFGNPSCIFCFALVVIKQWTIYPHSLHIVRSVLTDNWRKTPTTNKAIKKRLDNVLRVRRTSFLHTYMAFFFTYTLSFFLSIFLCFCVCEFFYIFFAVAKYFPNPTISPKKKGSI